MPCRARMLGHLSPGSGMEVALLGAEGSHPWQAGMQWLGHRAQAPSSHCFPRQTRAMFNQPAGVQKFCLLFRAAEPTELMGEGGCAHRFMERWAVKVVASLPTATVSPGTLLPALAPSPVPSSEAFSPPKVIQSDVLLGLFITQLTSPREATTVLLPRSCGAW